MVCLRILLFLLFRGVLGIDKDGTANGCPTLAGGDLDNLPQDQFVDALTNPCRYDRFVRPNATTPFNIQVKVDVNHLEVTQSQFTAYMTLQYKYKDVNLDYESISPSRSLVLGDESLKTKIWTPRLLLKDQDDTNIVDIAEKDVLVSITKTGFITYTYKMVATFYCWMDLKKFPFDIQTCTLAFSDWSYNMTNLKFDWNKDDPLTISRSLHFTEFILDDADFAVGQNEGPYPTKDLSTSVGDFSELVIKFKFHRDIGFYMLDFFLPSYLLVFTAWVTFWLQADAGPPRATLGASTVVAFITLHLGVTKDIPKVSYIKASDIWFLGISCFIFSSLAEFAFVNVIWRRKKIVELKKPKQKYIWKSAVMPKKARDDLRRYESTQTLSVISKDSLNGSMHHGNGNYSSLSQEALRNADSSISIPEELIHHEFTWTKMTPQQVAIYIDRKARIIFPIVFLIFNILYWTFVYCL